MSSSRSKPVFQSPLAPLMVEFVRERRAIGYRYEKGAAVLMRFDRFLAREAPHDDTLSRSATRKWLAKGPHESGGTQQARLGVVRQFAQFLCRLGHPAYVPDGSLAAKYDRAFPPRVLTHAEVARLLREADGLTPTAYSPHRHLVMPEVFRLLYGCGLRVGEVVKLRVADVDLDRGVLTVRDGKFGKDRLVPPALPLVMRLRSYHAAMGARPDQAIFFPSKHDGPYLTDSIYILFRELLHRSGIPHGGKGKGPRLHDLRHTFAVHALLRWYREGADLNAKLPVLATYMGHRSVEGTQRYLHLTAELFPEVTSRSDAAFGGVIPRRAQS
ncbi:MAG: tyrosine-type recombinase/integrase [Gammaproteobacteria bacterium]|nr:tyrosine-type recombinase/integrase [Gammaproteobacteria bacterium]